MAGLVKAKKYEWKDTNLSLFGSDLETNVKKASAETEKAWQGAGEQVSLKIWRIVRFKVRDWPKDQYGQFYNGDSYIILNTYKEPDSDALLYDVHFWIGRYSSQDEYGTAAYKTVELDTLLDDKPIQHREVMNHESDLFKSYFPSITILDGGADSGFQHIGAKEYKPRLLHFHGQRKSIEVQERPLNRACLDDTDVFILDLGETLYQWNGDGANKDERMKAMQYVQGIKSQRGKCQVEVLDQRDTDEDHPFYMQLSNDPLDEEDEDEEDSSSFTPSVFRLSDESGTMTFSLVSEGPFRKASFDTKDVFIADTGKTCYVWVGQGASPDERKQAMQFAHNYLQKTKHPLIPVACLQEGKESKEFLSLLS